MVAILLRSQLTVTVSPKVDQFEHVDVTPLCPFWNKLLILFDETSVNELLYLVFNPPFRESNTKTGKISFD